MRTKIKTLWDHATEIVMERVAKKVKSGYSANVSEADIIKEAVELSKRTPFVKLMRKKREVKPKGMVSAKNEAFPAHA